MSTIRKEGRRREGERKEVWVRVDIYRSTDPDKTDFQPQNMERFMAGAGLEECSRMLTLLGPARNSLTPAFRLLI